MGKVIANAASKTLVLLICVALLLFAIMSLGFPQHMATFCENAGMYSYAVRYTSLRYSYTGDVSDISRCAEDSILSGDYEFICENCAQLISHDDYEELCAQKDEYYSEGDYSSYTVSYNQYICGKYSVALAATGERETAVDTALSANGLHSFVKGNALAVLTLWASENSDGETATLLCTALAEITLSQTDDATYFASILQIAQNAAA